MTICYRSANRCFLHSLYNTASGSAGQEVWCALENTFPYYFLYQIYNHIHYIAFFFFFYIYIYECYNSIFIHNFFFLQVALSSLYMTLVINLY